MLDSGDFFEVDSTKGTGQFVNENEIYTNQEVVRLISSSCLNKGDTFSQMLGCAPVAVEERKISGKALIGSFEAMEIDRGPLPHGK